MNIELNNNQFFFMYMNGDNNNARAFSIFVEHWLKPSTTIRRFRHFRNRVIRFLQPVHIQAISNLSWILLNDGGWLDIDKRHRPFHIKIAHCFEHASLIRRYHGHQNSACYLSLENGFKFKRSLYPFFDIEDWRGPFSSELVEWRELIELKKSEKIIEDIRYLYQ